MNETNNKDWNQPGTWAEELVEQAKADEKKWFWVWVVTMGLLLITLGFLVGTNKYWIDVFQSYDIVTQDGSGLNNYNTGNQGDVLNESKDTQEEERE